MRVCRVMPFQVAAFSLAYRFPLSVLVIAQYVTQQRCTVQYSFAVLYTAVNEPLRAFAPDFVPTLDCFYGRQSRPYINPRSLYQYACHKFVLPLSGYGSCRVCRFNLTLDGRRLATNGACAIKLPPWFYVYTAVLNGSLATFG